MAKNGQLSKGAGQIGYTAPFSVGGINGQGQVGTLTKNCLDQAGKTSPRADLDKGRYSGSIDRFDLGDELHRSGQLVSQKLHGRCRFGRIFGCRAIGIDRQLCLGEFNFAERRMEWLRCSGDQFAMKGGCHRQFFPGKVAACQDIGSAVDLAVTAGEDRLIRCIAVGNHQLQSLLG